MGKVVVTVKRGVGVGQELIVRRGVEESTNGL